MLKLSQRLTLVILTYNRVDELLCTLAHTLDLRNPPDVIVVDNASSDDTSRVVRERYPDVTLITTERNMGAAARNLGVELAQTPYVAFADDDSWWAEGSLDHAADLLDTQPNIAALCARILLGTEEREDPICAAMAASPLPSEDLPGPALLGFVACATVFRRHAFLQAGGYREQFFVGGEEELLTLDLVSLGWRIAYVPRLTAYHHPSPQRDNAHRQEIVMRNALWVAWLRFPWRDAWKQSLRQIRSAPNSRVWQNAVTSALLELKWIWRERKVLPEDVLTLYWQLHA